MVGKIMQFTIMVMIFPSIHQILQYQSVWVLYRFRDMDDSRWYTRFTFETGGIHSTNGIVPLIYGFSSKQPDLRSGIYFKPSGISCCLCFETEIPIRIRY
ncbi:MAG: hypothetical protein LUQ22_02730 [Methanotrichaceae archaeon]|nr:hypothetical protein [Methanotrichaceae archaeon]